MAGLDINDNNRTRDRMNPIAIKNGTAYLKIDPGKADIQIESHTINGTAMEPLDFFLGVEQIIKARREAMHDEPHDPRVVNLTPYTLVIDSKGEKTTIPFSNYYAVFERGGEIIRKRIYGQAGMNAWPVILETAGKTFIVTEDVGMWLTRPENAHEWKGRVVGPVGLEGACLGPNPDKPKVLEVTGEWVMYKDFPPPLSKVVFEPDQSVSPFSVIN